MNRPLLFLTLLFALPSAHAQWQGGVATEQGSQTESLLSPRENSSRYSLHLHWQEDGDSGLLYGYRGKLYNGHASYDTYTPLADTTLSTSTDYSGMTHEGQLISRNYLGSYQLDYVGGLGWDSWRRSIGGSQIEDYSIIFLRTGVNLDQPAAAPGFHGGGGLKLPLRTSEGANPEAAFGSNSSLAMGRRASLYAEVAYRIDRRWDIVGYYDSWLINQTDPAYASPGSSLYSIIQPDSNLRAFGLKAMHSF